MNLIFTLLYIGHSDIFLFFCLGEDFNEGNGFDLYVVIYWS
jgi:hypothetical protein